MNRNQQQSALLLAGAAAGVAAAWFGRRQLALVSTATSTEPVVEPTQAELPLGSSADPAIDHSLSRRLLPQDATTGAALLGEPASVDASAETELDDIWRAELTELEGAESYDSIAPEDLGTAWLERATQTTREPYHAVHESGAPPVFEGALMSEATLASAHAADALERDEPTGDEQVDDEQTDDESGALVPRRSAR